MFGVCTYTFLSFTHLLPLVFYIKFIFGPFEYNRATKSSCEMLKKKLVNWNTFFFVQISLWPKHNLNVNKSVCFYSAFGAACIFFLLHTLGKERIWPSKFYIIISFFLKRKKKEFHLTLNYN